MDKGDVHVDWIISMGFFIVGIIAIFTFFRPLEKEETDKSILINNLVEKFNENFTWEVKTTPLFVKNCHRDSLGINYFIDIYFQNWSMSFIEFRNKTTKEPIDVNDLHNYQVKCDIGYSESKPNEHFYITSDEAAVFYIIYTNKTSKEYDKVNINVSCSSNDLLNQNFDGNCEFGLGGSGRIDGINEEKLNFNDPYFVVDKIKSNWKFPSNNEFWINSSDLDINYKTAEPFEQADVFVKVVKTFVVMDNGTVLPVDIVFRVW